jgi:AraC-like DNA-binding protein
MDGTVENIEIAPGMLLTVSDFILQEDIELTTTHSDLNLFQISFCLEGGMEWSYINTETTHHFRIGAQQSQVRYGMVQECRSKIRGNHRCQSVSITLDETVFEQIFSCINTRGALCDTSKESVARVYTYTPNISKILSEIIACPLCEELKNVYLQGKLLELIAVYCDEVICKSPANDFGIRISTEDYTALLKAREIISQNYTHPLTIPKLAKSVAINEQRLKNGFKRCFGITVNEYITEKRMETAQKLLKTGKYTVSNVAWMVGYLHTGYFIGLFRKHYGLSPGEVLKTNK